MKRILKSTKPDLPRRSEIFHKITHLLAVLVCLALVIPSFSCAEGQPPFSKRLELKLEKAPRLNEPVKLKCIRQTSDFVPPGQQKKISDNATQGESAFVPPGQEKKETEKTKHEKITLEFERVDPKTRRLIEVPAQEVLVGGSLNWEGDMTGEPLDFSATIKFPYEGNWGVYARSTHRPQDKDAIFLNVTEDLSSFGWPRDYRPNTGDCTPNERYPIIMDIDITEVPRLGEPAQFTWSINSIRDIAEASGEIEFYIMQGTDRIRIPVENVLIEGDLAWKGSLKKDITVQLSATIKFPKEGDWKIIPRYRLPEQTESCAEQFFLHIGKDKGKWGWAEPHEKPPPEVRPPAIPLD